MKVSENPPLSPACSRAKTVLLKVTCQVQFLLLPKPLPALLFLKFTLFGTYLAGPEGSGFSCPKEFQAEEEQALCSQGRRGGTGARNGAVKCHCLN